MSRVWPDRVSNDDKNRLIGELLRGRDSAIQLQALLSKASRDDKAALVDEMLGEILRSFNESISIMRVSDDVASADSGKSKKMPGSKQARDCCKRSRRGSQSLTTIAATVEDGYAWRKYGQKEILNSKFPRCYFRCTHKHDQGCKAIKQVQKMEDHPNIYRITYLGQHSCREIMSAPQMIPDSDPLESNVPGTRRESKYQICDPDNQPKNPFRGVKDEHKDDSASDLTDCTLGFDHGFPYLPGFGSSADPTTDFPLWSFSNDGFRDFPDTDFMSRYINFDGDFQFPGSELV